ncbi:MAG TPA: glycosyltransferase family 4 protein [Bryobacteraceae bacterium]|nr:glycosyltransferase family 4 protein [Bryobacteraceae bacterium]
MKTASRLDIGIALSTLASSRGGLETTAVMLTRGLAARGHKITLIAGLSPGRRLPEDLADLPARWLLAPHVALGSTVVRAARLSHPTAFRLSTASFQAVCALNLPIRGAMSRLSVTMTFLPRENAWLSQWRERRRLAHVSYYSGGGSRWLARDRSTIRLVNPAVAAREDGNLIRYRAHGILPSGVPTGWLGEAFEIRPAADSLLFVGRLEANKGVMELLDIFHALADQIPALRLRIVGEGHLRRAMEDAARHHGTTRRITFAGALPQHEIRAEMQRADLLLLPTHFENFPLTLLEASAVGLPYVASDIPGIRGLTHSAAELIPRATAAWSQRIRDLLSNPLRRQAISDCGRRWAAQFSWDKVVDSAEQYLFRAVEEARQA